MSVETALVAVVIVLLIVHMAVSRLIAALTEMLVGLTRVIISIVVVAGLLSLATQATKPISTEAAVSALPGAPTQSPVVKRRFGWRYTPRAKVAVARSAGMVLRDLWTRARLRGRARPVAA